MYIIRDDRGYMVGQIGNFLAEKVIRSTHGELREKKYVDGSTRLVFVILEAGQIITGENTFYLWENYYLYKK